MLGWHEGAKAVGGKLTDFIRSLRSSKEFAQPDASLKPSQLTDGAQTLELRDPLICRAIFEEICVLANGDIVCSCANSAGQKVYGNVLRDRIADVYSGPDYISMRENQLTKPGTSWCPAISQNCSLKVYRPSYREHAEGRTVRMLQLEPLSYCNLRCPECAVTHMVEGSNPAYKADRQDILSLETMLDVVDQLPDLERLLFFNYGEPFMHPQAIPFLREVRSRRPDVVIHTNTNGTVLDTDVIDALAKEALVDRIIFSIDGARQESFARYRVRGKLEKALQTMEGLATACELYGVRDRVEIMWQYILFEWNDSDEEIAEAKVIADKMNVPMLWIVTHTSGASQRFLPGSEALAQLVSGDAFNALSCDMRAQNLRNNNGWVEGAYGAKLAADVSAIDCEPGAPLILDISVTNCAPHDWLEGSYSVNVQLQTMVGKSIAHIEAVQLPATIATAGASSSQPISLSAPETPGNYHIFVDVRHDGVCLFSDRGSAPLVIPLQVAAPVTACTQRGALQGV